MIATGAGRDVARARIADVRLLAGRLIVRVIVRVAVEGVLDMLRRGPARLAAEGEEDEPPAVEAGEQRREHADEEGEATDRGAAGEGRLDDGVLRLEAGEAYDGADTARSKKPKSARQPLLPT